MKEGNKSSTDKKNLYVFDAAWIIRYKEYLATHKVIYPVLPGRIDNRDLEKKALLNTVQENDYFSVSEDTAKFILMLYGGGPVMTQYNLHEIAENYSQQKARSVTKNVLSPNKNLIADDLTTNQSMSILSDTSTYYNRPKKTKSALEQRYANPGGWVQEANHHLLDDSSTIYNCKHPGDLPAFMDDEDSSNNHMCEVKQKPHSGLLSVAESAKPEATSCDVSIMSEAAGNMFKEALQKYIDKNKHFGKHNHVDFSKQAKLFIHLKLRETLEENNSSPVIQEPDPLATVYIFPGLAEMDQKCNSMENQMYFCYLNSVLQFLFSVKEMVYYFHKDPEARIQNTRTCREFKKVVDEYQTQQLRRLDATPFLECFRSKLQVNLQQDVDELLRLTLDQLQQELKPQKKRPGAIMVGTKSAWLSYCVHEKSILTYLFTGETKRKTICFNCQHASEITETFDILSLSLGTDDKVIEDVFASNFASELIEEGFQCSACKRLSPATSKLLLTRMPRYLIIQLKRFSLFPKPCKVTQEIGYRDKDSLDLHKFSLSTPNTYQLISAVHHSGSITNGHYRVSGIRNDKVDSI